MLNFLINTCVKYVNNQRLISGITIVNLSTKTQQALSNTTPDVVQTQFTTPTNPYFYTTISTYVKQIFHLLHKSFTHNPQHLLLELKR
jgi:hypothetical protein